MLCCCLQISWSNSFFKFKTSSWQASHFGLCLITSHWYYKYYLKPWSLIILHVSTRNFNWPVLFDDKSSLFLYRWHFGLFWNLREQKFSSQLEQENNSKTRDNIENFTELVIFPCLLELKGIKYVKCKNTQGFPIFRF